jgi:hypothetical protein
MEVRPIVIGGCVALIILPALKYGGPTLWWSGPLRPFAMRWNTALQHSNSCRSIADRLDR